MLDPDGNVTIGNEGAQRLKGWTAAEMVGKPADLFYPDDAVAAGKPATIRAEAVTRGKIEMDDWRVRKDGSEFLAHIAITALKNLDGTVRCFAIVVRDITDQRAAESALRNSATPLRSILSLAPDGKIGSASVRGRVGKYV